MSELFAVEKSKRILDLLQTFQSLSLILFGEEMQSKSEKRKIFVVVRAREEAKLNLLKDVLCRGSK